MAEQNYSAVIQQLGAYFGQGDVAGILSLMSEDMVWQIPGPLEVPYIGRFVGHQGFQDFWNQLHKTVTFTGTNTDQLIEQGNTVIALGWEKGIVNETKLHYGYEWAQVYTFDTNGKIASMYQYFNPMNILAGVMGKTSL